MEDGIIHMEGATRPVELHLSTRDQPPEKQFAAWRDVMIAASAPVRLELKRPKEGFAADMLLRSLGALQLVYTESKTSAPNLVQYTHARSEVARTEAHSLIVSCHLSEEVTLSYNGVSRRVDGAGTWTLLNTEDQISGTCHELGSRQIMLRIPGEMCSPLLKTAGHIFGVPQKLNSLANKLVSDYLRALVHSPLPDSAHGVAISRHFVDLLALALKPTREQFEASESGVHAALHAAIEREIEEHYLENEFGPASAAAMLRITPRYLHKILEPTGISFSERVMQKRLEHAKELLRKPLIERMSIFDVALDSGFRNAEHFSRRFRAAFGMTPRAFRQEQSNIKVKAH